MFNKTKHGQPTNDAGMRLNADGSGLHVMLRGLWHRFTHVKPGGER